MKPEKQDQIDLSLSAYLKKYRRYYNSRCDLLENPTPKQIRERFVFSVFTVHRQFKQSKIMFEKFKGRAYPERVQFKTIQKSRCGLYNQAYSGLRSWKYAKECINNPEELLNHKHIKGISLAKLNFFLALIHPKDYFLCLDVHMLRFYGVAKNKLTESIYDKLKGMNAVKAHALGHFPFAFQWGVWEYLQKKGEIDHSFLWK